MEHPLVQMFGKEYPDKLQKLASGEEIRGVDKNTITEKIKTQVMRDITSPSILSRLRNKIFGESEEVKKYSSGVFSGLLKMELFGGGGDPTKSTPSIGMETYTKQEERTSTIAKRIARNETGIIHPDKQYSFRKKSGNKKFGDDLGKYQITEGELRSYSKRYLGRQVTAEEFINSPELQDSYMNNKIDYLRERGYSINEILATHRGGANYDPEDTKIKRYIESGKKPL